MGAAEPSVSRGFTRRARPFTSSPENWVILARNMIPFAGVYLSDWSVAIITFNYWFDGVSALAAQIASLSWRTVVELRNHFGAKLPNPTAAAVVGWVLLFGVFGIPYWIMLSIVREVAPLPAVLAELLHTPLLLVTFGSTLISHVCNAFHNCHFTLLDAQLRSKVQSALFAIVFRVAMMIVLVVHLRVGVMLVPLVTFMLTGLEV